MPKGNEHFDFIDGIRALCALFVLLGHAWFQPTTGLYSQRWMSLLGLSYAHLAVVVFIVVSGFVITLPIVRRADDMGSLLGFLKRRARRILPPYYAALLLTSLFILVTGQNKTGTVWDFSVPLSWQQFLSHALLLHNFPFHIPGGTIAYQFWSIAVEWQIYLLVPLLVLGIRRVGYLPTLALATILSAAVVVLFPGLEKVTVWFVVLFLSGAGAARVVVLYPQAARRVGMLGLLLSLGTLALIFKKGNAWFSRNTPWTDMALGFGFGALIAGLAIGEGKLLGAMKRLLRWRPLVFVGSFSYSLYLVHTPLLHAFWLLWSHVTHQGPVGLFALLLLSCPAIVAISWCFFVAFERPFMRAPATAPRPAPAATPAAVSADSRG